MTERERQLMEDFDLFEMGVLGADEAAEVRRALIESNELCEAFLARDASNYLLADALRQDQSPRDARDNFLREMRHSQPAQSNKSTDRQLGGPANQTKPGFRWWGWPTWSFASVAVLLAIATAVLLMQNSAYRQTNQTQSAQLSAQEQQLAQMQAQDVSTKHAAAMLATLQASDTTRFVLTRAQATPQPQIKTFFRRSTGQVVLLASNLPPVAPGMTYELWMIPMDSKTPMPAGMFQPDAQGNVSLTMTQTAANHVPKMFAVTVEPAGGSPAPTSAIVFSGAQGG